MNNVFGKLIAGSSVEGTTEKNLCMLNKAIDRTISEAALDHLDSLLASKRATIEMPAASAQYRDRFAPSGEAFNPLDIFLFIEPECEYSYGNPVAFQTSLQEVLCERIENCRNHPGPHGGMEGIADALRELADEIDRSLSRKAKRSRNDALKLV
jgi:hypothetical protein